MKSIFLVFVITVLFLVGMTKFNNDTNYNEAIKYAELSQYYNNLSNVNNNGNNDDLFVDSIELEISFTGEVKSTKAIKIVYASFLSQAIDKIGGLKSDADTRCINYNFILLTNSTFYIPGGKNLEKVSINDSDKEELMELSGIGSVTANNIIEYRKTNGKFESLESLLNVNGIGTQTFNRIKDSIIL